MQKKPFNKDIPSFVRVDENWVTVWRSLEAKLRIDRLKYTTITRLVREGVVRPYSPKPEQEVIAYDFNVKKWMNEIIRFNHPYIDHQPPQSEFIQAVNSQWGTVDDDKDGSYCLTKGVLNP